MAVFLTQFASALGWVIYGSFYEWFFHKFWMHEVRTPREAFRGHAIIHHNLYKGDEGYFVPEDEHAQHILLKPYALPLIFLMHLPIILLIEKYIPHTAIGGCVSVVVYFVVYEYMHWNMHVPRKHFVEKFKWFQFLRHHHHLHHKHPLKNFCVLFPLADWMTGTMVTDASLERRKQAREAAIKAGNIALEGKHKPKASAPTADPSTFAGKMAISRAKRAEMRHQKQVAAVKKMMSTTVIPPRKMKQR